MCAGHVADINVLRNDYLRTAHKSVTTFEGVRICERERKHTHTLTELFNKIKKKMY